MKQLPLKILFSFGVIILTALTQIGGLVLCVAVMWHRNYNRKGLWLAFFVLLYAIGNYFLVPHIAPFFGREQIVNSDNIKPANVFYKILNRNYVAPELNVVLSDIAEDLKSENITLTYLDAGFPFINGFPLLPHLSHNDGKKIDISFVYINAQGQASKNIKSRSGYGVFEYPKTGEINQAEFCKEAGYFQYNYSKYLSFGSINDDLKFSNDKTRFLLQSIVKQADIEKVYLEPHLVNRLQVNNAKIRFHGCGAVRHDDHLHLQIK